MEQFIFQSGEARKMEPEATGAFPADVKRHILSFWDGDANKILFLSMVSKDWKEIFADPNSKIWSTFFERFHFNLAKDLHPANITQRAAFVVCAKSRKNMADGRVCAFSLLSPGMLRATNSMDASVETTFIPGSSRFFAYRVVQSQGWGSYQHFAPLESQLVDLKQLPQVSRSNYLEYSNQFPALGKYLVDQPGQGGVTRKCVLERAAKYGSSSLNDHEQVFPAFKRGIDPPTQMIGNQDPTNPWVITVSEHWDNGLYRQQQLMLNLETKSYVPMDIIDLRGQNVLSGFHLLRATPESISVVMADIQSGKFVECLSLVFETAFGDKVAGVDTTLSPDATLGLLVRFANSNQAKRSIFAWSMKDKFDLNAFLETRCDFTLGFPTTVDHLVMMCSMAFVFRNDDLVVVDYQGRRTLTHLRFASRVMSVGAIDSARFIVSTLRDAVYLDFHDGNSTYLVDKIPLIVKEAAVLKSDLSVQMTSWTGNFESLATTIPPHLDAISAGKFNGEVYVLIHNNQRRPATAKPYTTKPTLLDYLKSIDQKYKKPMFYVMRDEDVANETDPAAQIRRMRRTHSRTGNRNPTTVQQTSPSARQGLEDLSDYGALMFKVTEVDGKLSCCALDPTQATTILQRELVNDSLLETRGPS